MVDNGMLHQGLQDVVDKYAGVAAGRSGEQAQAVKSALDEFYVDLNGDVQYKLGRAETTVREQRLEDALREIADYQPDWGGDEDPYQAIAVFAKRRAREALND